MRMLRSLSSPMHNALCLQVQPSSAMLYPRAVLYKYNVSHQYNF